MSDHYLNSVRRKYENFIKENGRMRLDDVKDDLRELINEIVSTTWHAAGEELEQRFRDAGYD